MKKIYANISEIKINGKPSDLYEVVTNLDKRIEALENETWIINNILFKYMNSNAGNQYEHATTTVYNLSKELYSSAININDLQNQVCKFVEKSNDYDLRHDITISSRKINIQIVKVPVNVNKVEYNKEEMKSVLAALSRYEQSTKKACLQIRNDKNNIGYIWKDRQYRDFEIEIDQLVKKIDDAIKVISTYMNDLDKHIRRLDS